MSSLPNEITSPNFFAVPLYRSENLNDHPLHREGIFYPEQLCPSSKKEQKQAASSLPLPSFFLRDDYPLNSRSSLSSSSKKQSFHLPDDHDLDLRISSLADFNRFFFYQRRDGSEEMRPIITFPSQKAKDRWEMRIEENEEEIERKLKQELEDAASQMDHEPTKPFVYLVGNRGHLREMSWQGSILKINISYEIGICYERGRRRHMEDTHIACFFDCKLSNGKTYPAQLFAIFDGHGGEKAAKYARKHMSLNIQEMLLYDNPDSLSNKQIWNALKQAFVKTSHHFAGFGGTTATVVLIINDQLWTANAGDSRTTLNLGGEPSALSRDSKPDDIKFRNGIEKFGGEVVDGKITSDFSPHSLGLARALGDRNFQPWILSRPKITMIPLSHIRSLLSANNKAIHIILASDGIYKVASTKQIIEAVSVHSEETVAKLAQNIVSSAYAAESNDNISIAIIKISTAQDQGAASAL